jgi:thioredoxin
MKHINSLETLDSINDSHDYVLLKFHATWCRPCQNFAPVVENVANARNDITFASVDIDELPDLKDQFAVRSVPTLVIVKQGKKVDTLVGSTTASAVNDWIDNTIAVYPKQEA